MIDAGYARMVTSHNEDAEVIYWMLYIEEKIKNKIYYTSEGSVVIPIIKRFWKKHLNYEQIITTIQEELISLGYDVKIKMGKICTVLYISWI